MAITRKTFKHNPDTRTDEVERIEVSYTDCVVEVRKYQAQRNLSDTLDYSDWQTVAVTDALVYYGRKVPDDIKGRMWIGNRCLEAGAEIPVADRFGYVDCSNLFRWRGAAVTTAEQDADFANNVEMTEDFVAWKTQREAAAKASAEKHAKWEAAKKAKELEAEKNRPVRGKKMKVVKGRKVPIGTVGTVAYISGSGGVLLKADHEWQNRKADGIWVDARNLAAVDAAESDRARAARYGVTIQVK